MNTEPTDYRLPAPGPGDPASNLEKVLHRIGRASTPEVPASPFGITLGQLLALPQSVPAGAAVIVGTERTVRAVELIAPALRGVPGALPEQVSVPGVTALVIDWEAFSSGPWLGANSHAAHALSEEIFEAGRILRATGSNVFGLPQHHMESSTDARLLSTCTVNLFEVPTADLAERAPQSPLWQALTEFSATRRRRAPQSVVNREGAEKS